MSGTQLRRPAAARACADAPGAAARSRARPWLLTANTLLVIVAVLVAAIMLWVARTPGPAAANELLSRAAPVQAWWTGHADSARRLALGIAWADLAISALLAGVIFCMGFALVQYEVFSGRVLPRRALRRHWREALLLAAGYGVVVGATLAAGWRPVYSLLLTALLMTLFFALLGWRSFAAQAAFVRRLQPFVVSTHLVDELMAPQPSCRTQLRRCQAGRPVRRPAPNRTRQPRCRGDLCGAVPRSAADRLCGACGGGRPGAARGAAAGLPRRKRRRRPRCRCCPQRWTTPWSSP